MSGRADVTARLRAAAAEHRPDRARMWARVVERAAAGPEADGTPEAGEVPERPARTWLRTAGAAAGLVTTLAGGGLVVGWMTGDGRGPETVRTAPEAGPGTVPEKTPAATPGGGGGPSGSPSAQGPRDGHLWSDGVPGPGGNAFWAQNDVVLRTAEPLTSLTVELRVALTAGVRHTGSWCTRPADDFAVTVREEGGALVYRWTLREGRTVPPGEHRFAGQYHHAEGRRDRGRDGYTAGGEGPGGPVSVRGGFP